MEQLKKHKHLLGGFPLSQTPTGTSRQPCKGGVATRLHRLA